MLILLAFIIVICVAIILSKVSSKILSISESRAIDCDQACEQLANLDCDETPCVCLSDRCKNKTENVELCFPDCSVDKPDECANQEQLYSKILESCEQFTYSGNSACDSACESLYSQKTPPLNDCDPKFYCSLWTPSLDCPTCTRENIEWCTRKDMFTLDVVRTDIAYRSDTDYIIGFVGQELFLNGRLFDWNSVYISVWDNAKIIVTNPSPSNSILGSFEPLKPDNDTVLNITGDIFIVGSTLRIGLYEMLMSPNPAIDPALIVYLLLNPIYITGRLSSNAPMPYVRGYTLEIPPRGTSPNVYNVNLHWVNIKNPDWAVVGGWFPVAGLIQDGRVPTNGTFTLTPAEKQDYPTLQFADMVSINPRVRRIDDIPDNLVRSKNFNSRLPEFKTAIGKEFKRNESVEISDIRSNGNSLIQFLSQSTATRRRI